MKKTSIKYIVITAVLVLVAFGVRGCLKAITHKMITDETTTIEETTETEYIQKEANEHTIHAIIYSLLTEVNAFEKYPLTQKFKNKFKDKFGIISEIDNVKMIGGGMSLGKDSNKEIPHINAHWKDGYRTDSCVETKYYFDYIVDENEQLDDLILLRKVDYGIDGKRLDGKEEVDSTTVVSYLYAFTFPYNDNIDTASRITPLSEDCKIINKPDFENNDYIRAPVWDYDNINMYFAFFFTESPNFCRVDYTLDDDYQFNYIEYVDVNKEELPDYVIRNFNEMLKGSEYHID